MKESNQVTKLVIAFAIFALGIPAIASASSQTDDAGHLTVRVSYADLNLSSEAGLMALYKRFKGAASRACGPRHSYRDAGSLQGLKLNRQCYDDLLSKLVAKVNNAKLDEIHEG